MSDEVVDDGLRESMLSVNVTLLQAFRTLITGDGGGGDREKSTFTTILVQ